MKRRLSVFQRAAYLSVFSISVFNSAVGQQPTAAENRESAEISGAHSGRRWIVRDPRTGKWYQREVRTVEQPVSRWEWKQADRTVYVPQAVTEVRPHNETIYIPQTTYVMQYRPKGTWNPFRTPVAAYEYVPHTTWVAQTRVTNRPTVVQKWVARKETVNVPTLVQSSGKAEQIVQTEIPRPPAQNISTPPIPQVAAIPQSRQPLFRIPLLARQPISSPVIPTAHAATNNEPIFPPPMLVGSNQRNYAAPLTTSIPLSQTAFRESWQTGLPATVAR